MGLLLIFTYNIINEMNRKINKIIDYSDFGA